MQTSQPASNDSTSLASDAPFELTDEQVTYFNTFGYLRIPGLFKDEIETLTKGFEDVFEADGHEALDYEMPLHFNERRVNLMNLIERSDKMRWLLDDTRINGTLQPLFGDARYEFTGSDGSLFYCESSWHHDSFGAPIDQRHIKISFYLDELTADTGAIRVIPGTHHYKDGFARAARKNLNKTEEIENKLGVRAHDIPSLPIPSTPGDMVCWDYRTLHASFHGGARRRLFSLSFRDADYVPTND
ncbi:MAG: phytanoyl-CoA dioxygenase family protein [Actinomycetota bacterium]